MNYLFLQFQVHTPLNASWTILQNPVKTSYPSLREDPEVHVWSQLLIPALLFLVFASFSLSPWYTLCHSNTELGDTYGCQFGSGYVHLLPITIGNLVSLPQFSLSSTLCCTLLPMLTKGFPNNILLTKASCYFKLVLEGQALISLYSSTTSVQAHSSLFPPLLLFVMIVPSLMFCLVFETSFSLITIHLQSYSCICKNQRL